MRKTGIFCLFVCCSLLASHAVAQPCSCHALLDSLISKTETDYAGFLHKVKEPGDERYQAFVKQLREQSNGKSCYDCYGLLEAYVGYFHDGHLFIFESPAVNPSQSDSLKNMIRHVSVFSGFRDSLAIRRDLDPAEGIWNDRFGEEIAIVKAGKDLFYGVLQRTGTPGWQAGMVKFELRRNGTNAYDVTYFKDNFSTTRFSHEQIFKNVLLGFGVYKLVRTFPENPELHYINARNPIQPVVQVIERNNILITVPSALIDGKDLDSTLLANDAAIKSTPNLIIDLRGNGGGNYIWGGLYHIANTMVHQVNTRKNGEDDFWMLASEDNAQYVNDRIAVYTKSDSNATRYYNDVIRRIRENYGRVIGFSYHDDGPDTAARKVYPFPAHVSVIIDKGVASAAEAFIMGLKHICNKLTLYGSNTYGMIDYMNVNTISFGGPGNSRYYFGYPVYFAKDIKTHPNNPTGLKPDVYVPTGTADWVKWVAGEYNRGPRK